MVSPNLEELHPAPDAIQDALGEAKNLTEMLEDVNDLWIWHSLSEDPCWDAAVEGRLKECEATISRVHKALNDTVTAFSDASSTEDGPTTEKPSMIRVGVNGFGRIGRQVVRIIALSENKSLELRHINATMDPEYMCYLLTHDTVHGKFPGVVKAAPKGLVIDGQEIQTSGLLINERFVSVSCTRDATKIPWKDAGVDYVCESTGAFLTTEACEAHLKGGAKKVVISAPAKDDTPVMVVGVNAHEYDSSVSVVSNASCTTNGLAPLVKIIHEKFGIKQGLMTTVHATTASQSAVDGASKKDWRAGRAASENIIPASTGAALAVAKCYPPMKGKLTGVAVRVPVVNISMIDLTVQLETETTYEALKAEIKLASETYAKGIVGYTNDAVVSSDFIGETCSTVFDANAGVMLNSQFVKLISWYDNEWGYSNRLVDLITIMAQKDIESSSLAQKGLDSARKELEKEDFLGLN
ncbi:hypothetical protein AB1Y20_003222 [Prymnesium parvum]|uniref:Glyceraldehyde-3-phosphate dehydrogenase n=1 Tax=Prymnesium parvum TaxID=97485 RepID=A0AB34JCT4_PRYPA|mmetsp:Transcript_2770/g.6445  ORF Transcript_2770/g.6445 Transcript_2770/m.6445 type:complete len:468 (-) Transcript_2770:187-1590(-)